MNKNMQEKKIKEGDSMHPEAKSYVCLSTNQIKRKQKLPTPLCT
jgi:hypothetical protein